MEEVVADHQIFVVLKILPFVIPEYPFLLSGQIPCGYVRIPTGVLQEDEGNFIDLFVLGVHGDKI